MHSSQREGQSSSDGQGVKTSIIMPSGPSRDLYYLDVTSHAQVAKAAEASLAKLPIDFSIKSERDLDGSQRFYVTRHSQD